MIKIVWHRHRGPRQALRLAGWRYSCLCQGLVLEETSTGRSAGATRFWGALAINRTKAAECSLKIVVVLWLGLILGFPAHAGPHLRGIKISVTNPSAEERRAEPIVIPISALRKIAPDLHAGSL